jgi:atypical dual specificity phosphatase
MLLNFSWVIDGSLAGMARPWVGTDTIEELREHGVGAIVSLTEEPLADELADHFHYAHIPVPDFHAPSLDQIKFFVETVRDWIRRDMGVAVHCAAGCGRTGTMLACYLVGEGESAREAIRHIRGLRPGSIETDEQERAIRDYAEFLARSETV